MSAQTFQLKGMQERLHKLLQSFSQFLSLPATQLPHHPEGLQFQFSFKFHLGSGKKLVNIEDCVRLGDATF